MRIAFFITPQQPVPPPGYGGHERQADILVRKFMEHGEYVLLFAGPGTTCEADEVHLASGSNEADEHGLLDQLLAHRDEFDCVIDISSLHLPGQVEDLNSISMFM